MLDETISLLREGYQFIPNRRRRYGTDVFETRLLGQRVVCMAGVEAARLLYDESRFERRTAMPRRIKRTLVGEDGVQTLDGMDHEHRKAMFMALMTPESTAELAEQARAGWLAAGERWAAGSSKVVLFDEVPEILLRAACGWAGVPLEAPERHHAWSLAGQMVTMVDGFATIGPSHWRARRARARAESRTGSVVARVRRGELDVPAGSAAHVVAHHRDTAGRLLDERVAAVELLNVLRPIVAIAWYVTFTAHALHDHPEWRTRLEGPALDHFVQEVRRFYPFTPFVGARARAAFIWQGHRFPAGRLALLDVYGAGHDPGLWEDPDVFAPERFEDRPVGLFDFIPQGGGDPHQGHRCAGEQITIEQMKVAAAFLTGALDYEVPDQDLAIPLNRIPTRPRDGFVLSNPRLLQRAVAG